MGFLGVRSDCCRVYDGIGHPSALGHRGESVHAGLKDHAVERVVGIGAGGLLLVRKRASDMGTKQLGVGATAQEVGIEGGAVAHPVAGIEDHLAGKGGAVGNVTTAGIGARTGGG